MNLNKYTTLVFDCDGVVLNSNKIKTNAFRLACSTYGEELSNALVDYHIKNGGVSRYKKFEYFMEQILPNSGQDSNGLTINQLLDIYANESRNGLMEAEIADKIFEFRDKTSHLKWLVASGGDQDELRDIFRKKEIFDLFDGGIFGSPEEKQVILSREIKKGNISLPAVYFGDSRADFIAAKSNGLDFIFIYNWTEFKDYKQFCCERKLTFVASISDLLCFV